MAYCKTCGNSVKGDEKQCNACGAELETCEIVEESEVEIVKHASEIKKRISVKTAAYTDELVENTFTVFDRKILTSLFLLLLFLTLAFFVRTVGVYYIIGTEIVTMVLIALPLLMVLTACILRNRGLLIISLIVASVMLLASATLALATMNKIAGHTLAESVVDALVQYCIACVCMTLSVEMLLGKRYLGAHCAYVVILSIGLLAHIILTLVSTPAADMGVLVTTWQILNVIAKVTMLCVIIFLFSNLGRVGIKTKF